jgi:hypothetical protein
MLPGFHRWRRFRLPGPIIRQYDCVAARVVRRSDRRTSRQVEGVDRPITGIAYKKIASELAERRGGNRRTPGIVQRTNVCDATNKAAVGVEFVDKFPPCCVLNDAAHSVSRHKGNEDLAIQGLHVEGHGSVVDNNDRMPGNDPRFQAEIDPFRDGANGDNYNQQTNEEADCSTQRAEY